MRATLLLLLGGILVWFVWHSFGDGTRSAMASSPGRMLPPETTQAHGAGPALGAAASDATSAAGDEPVASSPFAPRPSGSSSGGGGSPAAGFAKGSEEAPIRPSSSASARPQSDGAPVPTASSLAAQAPSAASRADEDAPPARSPDLAAELEMARAMVSEPQTFATLIAARSDLSRSRRDLALALAKAVTGAEAEARRMLADLQDAPDVRVSEREFLQRCIDHRTQGLASAAVEDESPFVRAAVLVAEARDADAARAAGNSKEAARGYSSALLGYVDADWKPDPAVLRRWSQALEEAQRLHRWNKDGDWPAITVKVEPGDTLIGIRKRVVEANPGVLLYTGQIERANQIKGAVIRPGQVLRVPTDKARMLVDLDAHWAFYLLGDEVAAAFEVGVGHEESATRPGRYLVGKDRKEQPMWFRPGHEPVPYGDPANPLGTRWIPWVLPDGQGTGLGFHGTNAPESVGKDQSQGCIRMRNADVEELYDILPTGTEILVQA